MNKTAIEYCDMTWNPVTGCYGPNGTPCEYCYARSIAKRFGGWTLPSGKTVHTMLEGETGVLDGPLEIMRSEGKWQKAPYPYDFAPTFHRYRLDEPQKVKKTQTIFVCSMADLFGDYIPDEWIKEVFDACEAAWWNRYLMLTKNPGRYDELFEKGIIHQYMDNFWFGTTITSAEEKFLFSDYHHTFLSIEPIMSAFDHRHKNIIVDFVIVGSETGNRKGKVIPEREWIEDIVECCKYADTPLFMKNSLRELMGDDFVQEYPW